MFHYELFRRVYYVFCGEHYISLSLTPSWKSYVDLSKGFSQKPLNSNVIQFKLLLLTLNLVYREYTKTNTYYLTYYTLRNK